MMMTTMNGGMNPSATTGAGRAQMTGSQQPMGMARTSSNGKTGVSNNGGGPEPHQGSNPGAQSDPGPKEVGYYDTMGDHMGGDDGVQNTAERPSPMRMGGVQGTQPNAGQRGGQNTGTSGSQTMNYSSEEEYGAGSVPGVTGASGAYQSRATSRLATATGGSGAMDTHSAEPMEDFRSTPASRDAREDAGVMDKMQGFASTVKDKVEGFFNVDLDQDGSVGGMATDTQMQGQDDPRTSSTYPYNERSASSGARSGTGRQASTGGLTAKAASGGAPSRSTGWKGATNAARTSSQQRQGDLVSA